MKLKFKISHLLSNQLLNLTVLTSVKDFTHLIITNTSHHRTRLPSLDVETASHDTSTNPRHFGRLLMASPFWTCCLCHHILYVLYISEASTVLTKRTRWRGTYDFTAFLMSVLQVFQARPRRLDPKIFEDPLRLRWKTHSRFGFSCACGCH